MGHNSLDTTYILSFFVIIDKLLFIPKTYVAKNAQNHSFSHKLKSKIKYIYIYIYNFSMAISNFMPGEGLLDI